MGLNRFVKIAIICAVCMALYSCVKIIDLNTDSEETYLFVDGNIVVGDSVQQLVIGRTAGINKVLPTYIQDAVVVVKDYTNNTEHVYTQISSSTYEAVYAGELETNYQLFITLTTGETYQTDTIKLSAAPNLAFTGDVKPRVRLNVEGDSVVSRSATAEIVFNTPTTPSRDLFVIRSRFEYAITDLICGPFDNAIKCYFIDDISVDQFSILDLSVYGVNQPITFQMGAYGIDARMSEESVVVVDINRADQQAKPYYQSVASSIELSANFFAPQPLTIPGNVTREPIGSEAALGYFGVIERTSLVLEANAASIKDMAGPPYCMGGIADLNSSNWDCCNCTRNEGALGSRPSYWP